MTPESAAQLRLWVILGYLAALILIGALAGRVGRGTNRDFLLASNSIGPVMLLLCLFGTTMTAFAIQGSSGEAYQRGIGIYGLMASSSGILHSFCVFLIGTRLWRFGRQFGYTTQIQFFRDRLDSRLVGWVLFPVLVGLVVPYLLVGVIGAGDAIQSMTAGAFPEWSLFDHPRPELDGSVPYWMGTLAVCLVVLAYVYLGGIRGTTWANAVQTLLFVVLGLLTFVLLAYRIGGTGGFLTSLQAATGEVDPGLLTRQQFSRLSWLSYLLIPLSMGMFPHLFQHWLTAKKASSFRLTIVLHPVFILLVWLPCVYLGIWGTVVELPPGTRPNQVLPTLVQSQLSPVMGGLLTAGILAAIMSSLDSQALCVGNMFATDLVGGSRGGQQWSEQKQLWIARGFVVLVIAVTWGISLWLAGNRNVFELGVWSFSGFASLFPLVFAAIYWRRLTAAGAVSAVLTMAGCWLVLFRESGWGSQRGYQLPVEIGAWSVRLDPVVVIFFATTVAMVLTSLLTTPPAKAHLARFFPSKTS